MQIWSHAVLNIALVYTRFDMINWYSLIYHARFVSNSISQPNEKYLKPDDLICQN